MMRSFLLAFGAVTLFATSAAAQESIVFVNVNFAAQAEKQHAFTQGADIRAYDETGAWESSHAFTRGGSGPDFGAGVRLGRLSRSLRNLGFGVSFKGDTKHTRDATVSARVPSPIFTDTFRSNSVTLSGLEHKESAVHVQALWYVPVTMEFDVALFAGPSFFTVRDEFVDAVTTSEVGGNFTSINLNAGRVAQKNSIVGYNIGLDARYMFTRYVGAGAMLRYSNGSVDVTPPANTGAGAFKIDAGGPEFAAGLRIKF